jgi:hypothetical protein
MSETTLLRKGQALHRRIIGGTTIVVAEGSVDILTPAGWAGDPFHQTRLRIAEGEAHIMQKTGGVAIAARSNAKLAFVVDDSHRRWLGRIAQVFLRRVPKLAKRKLAQP